MNEWYIGISVIATLFTGFALFITSMEYSIHRQSRDRRAVAKKARNWLICLALFFGSWVWPLWILPALWFGGKAAFKGLTKFYRAVAADLKGVKA